MVGWSDKTKLILISTLVEVVVEVDVELGNVGERMRKQGKKGKMIMIYLIMGFKGMSVCCSLFIKFNTSSGYPGTKKFKIRCKSFLAS